LLQHCNQVQSLPSFKIEWCTKEWQEKEYF